MKIEDIEKLLVTESQWEPKKNIIIDKLNNFFIKILSFFSILFSLSIIKELSNLGIEPYLIVIFGIFLLLLIITNEIIKVNKLISLFSFDKSIENIIIASITVVLSISISTYGIYKFLDKKEDTTIIIENTINQSILDTTNYYNDKINQIKNLKIVDVNDFSGTYNIYMSQLNQYKSDRDNYDDSQIRSISLREYYKDINNKIDQVNNNLIELDLKFNTYKKSKVNELENELRSVINTIREKRNENLTNFNDKNNIIIIMFIIFTIITEFGIIFIGNKIGLIKLKNDEITKHNEQIEKNKINYIRNSKEFKEYKQYIDIIEKLYTIKNKNSSITQNEIKSIVNNDNLTNNEIDKIIDDLRILGIISQPIRRIGSKLLTDKEESLFTIKKYYEPTFKKY